ncbi:hypothetical protein RSSM_00392 [Rhodopirellula sallentina SM41]|uniref:Secreted protein n=1 Tax=Rhodopirellula sallentina SM41 TaxID=1263870 RepID=M5U9R1_9BACT|nr:hypothetical protein RSSM_00392 [Rhodopirellula sallentina SM41]
MKTKPPMAIRHCLVTNPSTAICLSHLLGRLCRLIGASQIQQDAKPPHPI